MKKTAARLVATLMIAGGALGLSASTALAEESDWHVAPQEHEWGVTPLESDWHVAPLELDWG